MQLTADFLPSRFEGQGTLHFSENGSYTGTFENGIAKEVRERNLLLP